MGPGGGMSNQQSSSSGAGGGDSLSPWYQGDVVVGGSDATSGDRAALPGQNFLTQSAVPLLIVGAVLLGVVLWRRSSK